MTNWIVSSFDETRPSVDRVSLTFNTEYLSEMKLKLNDKRKISPLEFK